ncbi:hypothetical protein [Runella limosa]|uniref:hypothetical protein n=1 Tax=Runella limosa TaxID=370978 RepID=UPI0004902DD7|nr:hypothetical protein [Runella limosa]
MKRKAISILTTFVLVILPFLVVIAIGRYSPYVEGNNFLRYVTICSVISVAIVTLIVLFWHYSARSVEGVPVGSIFLFLMVCPLIDIFGLVAPPDLSLKMLEHPEREHLRYIFLFIAAILFGGFGLSLWMSDSWKDRNLMRGVIAVVFILAFVEFIWEFRHHYLYPEAMKEWISQGKKVEDFAKHYDNTTIVNIGVLGRLIQFSLIIWLSVYFYKLRQVQVWFPIVSIIFSLLGIVSATMIYFIQFNFPKGFEILMLFFIPGIPFFLLYWLGVALLTKFQKSAITG